MNKKTKALTTEQYKEIIAAMREGSSFFRPNERAATALVLEGNLGLRISDILKLRPCDIVKDGERYRLEIVEQKTGKRRVFTVPLVVKQYIENYCLRNGIGAKPIAPIAIFLLEYTDCSCHFSTSVDVQKCNIDDADMNEDVPILYIDKRKIIEIRTPNA